MCRNCAYSVDGKPGDSEECQICSRNPALLSRKFTPRMFRGRRIEKPIDFYISKEHYELLKEVLKEEIKKAARKVSSDFPIVFNDDPWSYWRCKISSPSKTTYSGSNSYQQSITGFSYPSSSIPPSTITVYTSFPQDTLEKYGFPAVSFKVTLKNLDLKKVNRKRIKTCTLKELMEDLDGLEL